LLSHLRGLGRQHLRMYRYRKDCDVPPRKLFRTLKTAFESDFLFGIKFNSLLIGARHEGHRCLHFSPQKSGHPFQYGFHAIEKISIPRSFQATPIALDRVVFAVVWRIVDQADFHLFTVGEVNHALQKLTSVTAALRAVVHVDNDALYDAQSFFVSLPPEIDSIGQKIAGLVAGGKKQKRFAVVGFKYSARNEFVLDHHVVIRRLDRLDSAR